MKNWERIANVALAGLFFSLLWIISVNYNFVLIFIESMLRNLTSPSHVVWASESLNSKYCSDSLSAHTSQRKQPSPVFYTHQLFGCSWRILRTWLFVLFCDCTNLCGWLGRYLSSFVVLPGIAGFWRNIILVYLFSWCGVGRSLWTHIDKSPFKIFL